MAVWTVDEKVIVKVAGETKEYESPVTADQVKEIAREAGITRFIVLINDEEASPEDFPVNDGTIEIKEYNEAK